MDGVERAGGFRRFLDGQMRQFYAISPLLSTLVYQALNEGTSDASSPYETERHREQISTQTVAQASTYAPPQHPQWPVQTPAAHQVYNPPAAPQYATYPSQPGMAADCYSGATPSYSGATPGYSGATPGYSGATPGYSGATPGAGTVGDPPSWLSGQVQMYGVPTTPVYSPQCSAVTYTGQQPLPAATIFSPGGAALPYAPIVTPQYPVTPQYAPPAAVVTCQDGAGQQGDTWQSQSVWLPVCTAIQTPPTYQIPIPSLANTTWTPPAVSAATIPSLTSQSYLPPLCSHLPPTTIWLSATNVSTVNTADVSLTTPQEIEDAELIIVDCDTAQQMPQ